MAAPAFASVQIAAIAIFCLTCVIPVNGVPPATHASIMAVELRQETPTPVQGIMSTLSSMVNGFVPYLRPAATASAEKPIDKAPSQKVAEQDKASHQDHEHANEPAESLPDGVVADGFFYEGKKANGEYFNDELPSSEALEVHSAHGEASSPGKLYDDNSEHPYYVVDKPAEGPAPPPLVYFTSGLRSNDASVAAWTEYYAKLRQYQEYYYPSYRRSGRAIPTSKSDD